MLSGSAVLGSADLNYIAVCLNGEPLVLRQFRFDLFRLIGMEQYKCGAVVLNKTLIRTAEYGIAVMDRENSVRN